MLRVTELRAHEPFAGRVGTSKWWVAGGCGLGESWWRDAQERTWSTRTCALDCGDRAP